MFGELQSYVSLPDDWDYTLEAGGVGQNALKKLQLPQQFFSITTAARSLVEAPKAEAQLKKYATRIPILILKSPAPRKLAVDVQRASTLHSLSLFLFFFLLRIPTARATQPGELRPQGGARQGGVAGWRRGGTPSLSIHLSLPLSF